MCHRAGVSVGVLPTADMRSVLHGATAAVGFHLSSMTQPPGLAETMMANSADAFFDHFPEVWTKAPGRVRERCR